MARWRLVFFNLANDITQIPTAGFELFACRVVIGLGQLSDDAHGAIAQLRAGGMQIDHQIAPDLAERDHGAGADDVERNLGDSPCFQAGGSGYNFRSNRESNNKIDVAVATARWAVARTGHRPVATIRIAREQNG